MHGEIETGANKLEETLASLRMEYPQRLYKYLEERWAERMLSLGEVQVGTLFGYRNVEALGHEIGDPGEGKVTTVDHGRTVDWRDTAQVSEVMKRSIQAPPDANISFANNTFIARDECPNCLVYCASKTLDAALVARTAYDTIVEIVDVRAFFSSLDVAVRLAIPNLGRGLAQSCRYIGRTRGPFEQQIHAAFYKERRHEYQNEYRAVWDTPAGDARVTLIHSSALRKTIRRIPPSELLSGIAARDGR